MTKKEREEFVAQLKSYLPELEAEINVAKDDLREARRKKGELEGIITSSNALLSKLTDPTNGVDKKLELGQASLDTIVSNAKSASEQLESINTVLATVESRIADMDSAYKSFLSLQATINDPETGLQAFFEETKKIRAKAQTATTRAATLLDTAESTLTKVNTYITNIGTAYSEFELSKERIDHPTDGLDAILKDSKDLRDKIKAVAEKSDTLFTTITGYKDEANNNVEAIKTSKADADVALAQIRDNQTTSENTKIGIKRLSEIAARHTTTTYLKKRTTFVFWVAIGWLIAGIVALVAAVILGHQLVGEVAKAKPNIGIVIARAVIVTPVLAFAFYAFRNYGKERNVAEQYAFKEISGATLEGHVEMLRRALPNLTTLDDQIADLTKDVIKSIHTEPSELRKSPRTLFSLNTKIGNLGAEFADVESTVESASVVQSKHKTT